MIGSAFVLRLEQDAVTARNAAESQALAEGVPGLLAGRLDDAMMLALTAEETSSTDAARGAVLNAVLRTDGLVRFLRFAVPVNALAVARNGTIAVAFRDGQVALLDPSGRLVHEVLIAKSGLSVDAVAFASGRPLLAAAFGPDVVLSRLQRGRDGLDTLVVLKRSETTIKQPQQTSSSVSISQNGRWLAAGGRGGLTLLAGRRGRASSGRPDSVA